MTLGIEVALHVARLMPTSTLPQALQRPDLEFVETHISWVFLGRDEVFKIKRPVDLGFLDFSTIGKRRIACEAEVRLNRRLAKDVYLGLVAVTMDAKGNHHFGGQGDVVDWAVHMRRLPDSERADHLAQGGTLGSSDMDHLASYLVDFHQAASCDETTSRYGSVESIRANIEENFEQTRETITKYVTLEEAREIESWQRAFLGRRDVFESRIAAGRIRDGHGDLRLEHVYFRNDGRITVLDCIEFNDRFRYADVCSDIAFLSMDLAWRNQVDLAERLLSRYAVESNDFDLYAVVDFYESYRAFVRGKIASFVATDRSLAPAVREQAEIDARRYFLLALAFERQPLVPPAVIAVGGMIASGKTTIADAIALELSAPVISTDRVRKHLLGLRPTESATSRAWSGAYDPKFTEEVYAQVLSDADTVLESKRPVIIDGSFRTRATRAAVKDLAIHHGAPFFMVQCTPSIDVCRARLKRREQEAAGASDARVGLLDEFVRRYEAIDELAAEEHYIVDTQRPIEQTIAKLRSVLPVSNPSSAPGGKDVA